MSNLSTFTSSIDGQFIEQNYFIVAMNNLVVTEQFYVSVLGHHLELLAPKFPIPSLGKACIYTLNNSSNCSLPNQNWAHLPPEWKQVNLFPPRSRSQQAATIGARGAVDFFYLQRWEQDIYNRFNEARKRYPEFFPCFELKESVHGLQYAIYFKPLTQHAKTLVSNALLFPHYQQFKSIEQLWQENGQSELDIIFERFPTQLALKLPRKSWRAQCKQLFLGLVNRGLELIHVDSLLVRRNAGI